MPRFDPKRKIPKVVIEYDIPFNMYFIHDSSGIPERSYGPFKTYDQAVKALPKYRKFLLSEGGYSTNPKRKGPKPVRVNPRLGSKGKKPNPSTVIYGRVLRIEAQKTQPHQCDAACKRSGHRYFHDFKASSNATIIGMPAGVDSKDRSLRIVSKERK